MIERIKYLNILVLLTFLVGQVQYAYASYLCTMKNAPVRSSSMPMAMDEANSQACDECSTFIQPESGQQIVQSNCVLVHLTDKSTLDNFTSLNKAIPHVVGIIAIVNQQSITNHQLSARPSIMRMGDSPPLDLPTFNSSLRI